MPISATWNEKTSNYRIRLFEINFTIKCPTNLARQRWAAEHWHQLRWGVLAKPVVGNKVAKADNGSGPEVRLERGIVQPKEEVGDTRKALSASAWWDKTSVVSSHRCYRLNPSKGHG